MTEEQLKKLKEFSDDAWYYLLLQRDPLYEKIKPEEESRILNMSKERGRLLAKKWLEAGDDIDLIQDRLEYNGVNVRLLEYDQKPPMVIFAALKTKPLELDLYMPALRLARQQLDIPAVWENQIVPETESIRNLILAHEAFHFMDDADPLGRYVERLEYKVGFIPRKASLHTTDEISAAVFAQELAHPNYNPGLLDVALLCAYQTKKENYASMFINALSRITEEKLK